MNDTTEKSYAYLVRNTNTLEVAFVSTDEAKARNCVDQLGKDVYLIQGFQMDTLRPSTCLETIQIEDDNDQDNMDEADDPNIDYRARKPQGLRKLRTPNEKLLQFMNLSAGTEVTVLNAHKCVFAYIEDNGLKKVHQSVQLDNKLATLFDRKESDVMSYFQLVRELSSLFT
jgi:hypothetical protein